jgi:hypothetical protein
VQLSARSAEGQGLELILINPFSTFGPVLSEDFSMSIILIWRLLSGELPGCSNIIFGVVDVRGVAVLYLLALSNLVAASKRFLATFPPSMILQEIALIFKQMLPQISKKTCTVFCQISSFGFWPCLTRKYQ